MFFVLLRKYSEIADSMQVKGRPYRHSELADTWLNQARGAGKSHLRSPVLEELLAQAEQYLWGGHEMDQVCSGLSS